MKQRAPGSLSTIGTLNIVFGSLFGFCCASFLISWVTSVSVLDPQGQDSLERCLQQEIPLYHLAKWGSSVLGVLLFSVMMISGIGLVSRRAWARLLAVVVALVLIPYALGVAILDLALVAPTSSRHIRDNPQVFGGAEQAPLIWIFYLMEAFFLLLFFIYALITLGYLLSRNVRDYFQHAAFDMDRYYDDELDPRRDSGEW
jgi:hypothetical protein